MSVLIDSNESQDFDFLLNQMGIETSRSSINKTSGSETSFPDFLVIPTGEPIGLNRKAAVEAMADLDKVEEQLRRELRYCGKLAFVYEGVLAPHPDGVYAGEVHKVETKTRRNGDKYEEMTSWGKVIHQPWTRWESFVWKMQDCGVPVIPTGSMQGTAGFLAYLHKNPENNLFQRLIPIRQQVLAVDPVKRDWLLFLMSIPSVGEEAARGLGAEFDNMHELVQFLQNGGELSEFVLPSKRRVGKALAGKIRKFLGVPQLVTA